MRIGFLQSANLADGWWIRGSVAATDPRPPLVLDNKKKIRRATEAAGIPYTCVCANSFAAYFVDYLLHPRENHDHVTIYATDPRAHNRVISCRPHRNIVSQLDLVSSWQNKTGRSFKTTYVSEDSIIKLSQTLPHLDNIRMAILHNIFIKGDQMSFELAEEDLEASKLYPDYNYTSVDELLDICLVNPPKPKFTSF
ncbi:hypothetical protein ACSBR1_009534 [Camellia fascicularis]